MDCDQRGCTPDYDDIEFDGSGSGLDLDWIPSLAGIVFVFVLAVSFGVISVKSYNEGNIPKSIGQALISAGFFYVDYRLINWGMVGGTMLLGGLWLALGAVFVLLASLGKATLGLLNEAFNRAPNLIQKPVAVVFSIVLLVAVSPIAWFALIVLYFILT